MVHFTNIVERGWRAAMVITNWKLSFTRVFFLALQQSPSCYCLSKIFFCSDRISPQSLHVVVFFKGSTLLQEICFAEVLTFRYISIANWFVQESREAKCVDAMVVKLTFSARQTLHSNLLLLIKPWNVRTLSYDMSQVLNGPWLVELAVCMLKYRSLGPVLCFLVRFNFQEI